MNSKNKIQLFLFIIFVFGYGLLSINDWKVALGVFLIHWYINVDEKVKEEGK